MSIIENMTVQKILIADDHHLVSEAVARVLTADIGARVKTVPDAVAALEAISNDGPFSIVLLDINMSGMHGIETVQQIVTANKPGAVVIFSGMANEDFVLRAIEVGARGYIPKSQPLASLSDAIRLIASGTIFVPFSKKSMQLTRASSDGLTAKQLEVLRLVSRGFSNKEIGIELDMTEVTVKMHMRNICSRLGTKNRTQAAMLASDEGLLR